MTYVAAVLADSPSAYWRLGEPSGGTAASQVNSPTVDMAYQNTPTLGVAGALVASGDTDTAVTFATASTEFCLLATSNALNVDDVLTLEAWIKRASVGVQMGIVGQSAATAWELYMNAGNAVRFVGNGTEICVSTQTVTDTTSWHHVVVTKNGASVFLYLDGTDVSGTVNNATLTSSIADYYIAFASGAATWDGSLDEVAIYPTALSAARVLAHFNAAQAEVTAPQVLSMQSHVFGHNMW